MKFFIVSPHYENSSNGVRVLYKLGSMLNKLGHEATISSNSPNPFNVPYKNFPDNEDIVIYPEVTHGNPCDSNKVVRYVLNKPGLLGGDKTYHDSEFIMYFCDELLKSSQESVSYPITEKNKLTISTTEDFFKYSGLQRVYNCFYIGKGSEFVGDRNIKTVSDKTIIQITKQYPNKRDMLAILLQGCDTLYSYDGFSMLNEEALLCGCNVMVLDSDRQWTKYSSIMNVKEIEILQEKRLIEIVEQIKEFFKDI